MGRPDLAVSEQNNITKFDLSSMMFDSVQRFKDLPDEIVLYPGHGAGSACGKNISNASSCTLGNQKKSNYAFLMENKEEFIKMHTDNIPAPPNYFFHDVKMNQNKETDNIDEIIQRANVPLKPAQFYEMVQSGKYRVIDCRLMQDFSNSYIPGSLFCPINGNMAIYGAQSLDDFESPVLLVCYPGTEQECIQRFARTGIENIKGYLNTFHEYFLQGFPYESVEWIEPATVFESYQNQQINTNIVDVRGLGEYLSGHIDTALHVPLPNLNQIHSEYLRQKDLEYFIHCKAGLRSMIAYSYLKSIGYTNVKNVIGGFDKMIKYGFKIIR